jgi:hypothetical protein
MNNTLSGSHPGQIFSIAYDDRMLITTFKRGIPYEKILRLITWGRKK